MQAVIQLILAALLPVAVSILFYSVEKRTRFGNLARWTKQIIYGVTFGGIAVLGTEFGVSVLGVTMNVRDAAPICAGLIFGAPAGMIAGVIGGVERVFAASWGAGEYTKIACAVATGFSGMFAAALRQFMFDDKKPAWYYGFVTGAVCEVLHMLLVFLTHTEDSRTAFSIVQKCAAPMILLCALSVGLACFLIGVLGREDLHPPREKTQLTQTFQRRLLVCVSVAFFFTSLFTYSVQNGVSEAQTENLLTLNLSDVQEDIADACDESMLAIAHTVADALMTYEKQTSPTLKKIAEEYDVLEINLINKKGIIIASTYDAFYAFDLGTGAQSAEFLVLLDGTHQEYVQEYGPTSYDPSIRRKYAGVALETGGFVQVGFDFTRCKEAACEQIVGATRNRHVGENGCLIICDEHFNIVSDRNNYEGQNLVATGLWLDLDNVEPRECFVDQVYGEDSYCMYDSSEGYYIVAVLPLSEAHFTRDASVYVTIFMEVLIFTALLIMVYILIKVLIVDNIREVNTSLAKITGGDLDVTVNVRTNEEFASLSDDINETVDALRHYIGEAAAKLEQELEFARTIQLSSLPSVFPPYPNREEFDIWAATLPAKEVGGDFYDFYLIGEDRLAFLIADVSGKGIPAAMFMMTAKTMIKNLAESGLSVDEVLTRANAQLCASNEAGMFVTAWLGILNLRTGHVDFANAGHNPPLVRRKGMEFEYLKGRPGFVLAGMDGVRYRAGALDLAPGDVIYLYTDGVTEATNAQSELYGEERLLHRMNMIHGVSAETMCHAVKTDVDAFVKDAPQFDDITMLCLKYKAAMEGDKQ